MKFSWGALSLLLLSLVPATGAWTPASTKETDALAALALKKSKVCLPQASYGKCNQKNVAIRREWGDLSKNERKAYSNAVLCLTKKPSKLNPTLVPGAKSRYDDFVAIHMNQTLSIHATANFLSWHRYFTWVFERALRTECGYEGYQPYWNWGRTALDPLASPLFDGSATSMSGNGVFAPHNCTDALPTHLNCIPPGAGGGCLASGPFKGMKVNLGPVFPSLVLLDGSLTLPTGFFDYNPRCVRRDISSWVSTRWSTDAVSAKLIKRNNNIVGFQDEMQGDFANGVYGVHSAGHYTIGGDPGGDFFASPGDPAFWLHHGNIDRTWWIWQNQDPTTRTFAIGGTITVQNNPPSRNGTLDDIIDLDVLSQPLQIRDVMSTTGGPLCYVYV